MEEGTEPSNTGVFLTFLRAGSTGQCTQVGKCKQDTSLDLLVTLAIHEKEGVEEGMGLKETCWCVFARLSFPGVGGTSNSACEPKIKQ